LLNFQSARNATKTVPLCPSHLPDSGGIFTFSNKVCMEKISQSVRQAKQEKFLDANCTCPYSPYSPYGDMAGPYSPYADVSMVTWQMLIGRLLASRVLTRVQLVANNKETRGPIHGCHVSPSLYGYM
jgi:hypothetical protein